MVLMVPWMEEKHWDAWTEIVKSDLRITLYGGLCVPAIVFFFWKKAIKIKPEFAAAYNNLGIVLNAQGRRDEAIHAYETALKFHPGFLEPHISLAKLHEAGGDIDKAIFSYPDRYEVYKLLFPELYNAVISLAVKTSFQIATSSNPPCNK